MNRKKPTFFLRTRLYKKYLVYGFLVTLGFAFWLISKSEMFAPVTSSGERGLSLQSSFFGKKDSLIGEKQSVRRVDRIEKGETLNLALLRNGLSQKETLLIANVLRKKVNLRAIRPGEVIIIEKEYYEQKADEEKAADLGEGEESFGFTSFELVRTDSGGLPIRFRIERQDAGTQSKDGALGYALSVIETEVTVSEELISGEISTSLYDAILLAGGDPSLVNRFSELFGWQVDFYRETQPGDSFKLVVERKFADGRFFGFGLVKGAEYQNAGKTYRGFFYSSPDGKYSGYFDEKGVSLEKSFFKSPMQLTRITSRYGQRFHPVLGKLKKHNGIDYGAPTGTPFWAVADGTILEARYSPTAGNMIRVRHSNGFVTEYFHASRIARGIRAGAKVRQKQVLGYVGTTGRSTGPHLHFGMLQNKTYVNPSKQKIALEISLPKKDLTEYQRKISSLLAQFDPGNALRT